MKKLWLLLLAGGAMTFTPACNNDDDDNGPVCPVECTVPATAEIGSEMTVAGQGFAATAEIALRDASGTETKLEEPEITSAGFTGTVPTTLTPGSYGVILYQEGTWEIGTVALSKATDKACPVLSIILPEAIRLNGALEIAGAGFSDDMGIVLENAADQSRTELTTSTQSTGVSCTIPEGLTAGTYNVILTQGIYEWTIGTGIPAAVYKRLKSVTKKIATQYLNLTVEQVAETLAPMLGTTAEELIASGNAQIYMDQMFSDGETTQEYIFEFDTNGNPNGSMRKNQSDETAVAWYTITVNDNEISATNNQAEEGGYDMFSFDWTLVNGRIDRETTVTPKTATSSDPSTKRTNNYAWVYDTQGLWSGVNYTNGSSYLKNLYDAGKFQDAVEGDNESAGSIFTYGTDSRKNAIFGIDVAKILYTAQSAIFEDNQIHAICLNVAGQASQELPTNIGIMDMTGQISTNPALEYTFDNDGYVTKVAWNISGKDPYGFDYNEQSSFDFVYE